MLGRMEIEATHTNLDSRAVAGASVIAMLIALAFANFAGDDEGIGAYVVTAGFSTLVAAFLYLRAIPRSRGNGTERRATFVLTGLSVLLLPVFWAGLTLIIAPAAAWLALAAPGKGTRAALAVATLVYLVAAVGCVIG
jgi:hypothetical protein